MEVQFESSVSVAFGVLRRVNVIFPRSMGTTAPGSASVRPWLSVLVSVQTTHFGVWKFHSINTATRVQRSYPPCGRAASAAPYGVIH